MHEDFKSLAPSHAALIFWNQNSGTSSKAQACCHPHGVSSPPMGHMHVVQGIKPGSMKQ